MIVFTHIPKTAGTTFKYILRRNFGIHHIDSQKIKRKIYTADDLRFARKVFFGAKAISGHNLVNPMAHLNEPGIRLITILRDPVVRCASHYQDARLRGKLKLSFKDWIGNPENQNLSCKIVSGSDDLESAKKLLKETYLMVGFTERFEETLKLMDLHLKEPLDYYSRRRIVASNNDIKKSLLEDEASLRLLKLHNQLDQQLYDYAMEVIFLPAVEKHKEEMDPITIPRLDTNRFNEIRNRCSVGYNKYIYRQLIKVLKK